MNWINKVVNRIKSFWWLRCEGRPENVSGTILSICQNHLSPPRTNNHGSPSKEYQKKTHSFFTPDAVAQQGQQVGVAELLQEQDFIHQFHVRQSVAPESINPDRNCLYITAEKLQRTFEACGLTRENLHVISIGLPEFGLSMFGFNGTHL